MVHSSIYSLTHSIGILGGLYVQSIIPGIGNTSKKKWTKFLPLGAHNLVGKTDIRQKENHMSGYILTKYIIFFKEKVLGPS